MHSTQISSPGSINSLSELRRRIVKSDRFGRNRRWDSCRCLSGHQHDSRGEAQYCNILLWAKKARQIKDYAIQVTFDLKVNDKLICRHRVDFLVYYKGNQREVREFKGYGSEVWQIKKKLFEACYPEIPYLIKTERDLI